jgi:hypothetical protein
LAAPNAWLGKDFQLTASKPQDLIAQWFAKAKSEFEEMFKDDRGDLLD